MTAEESVAQAVADMRAVVGEAMSKAPLATFEATVRKAIEESGLADEIEIVNDGTDHWTVNCKLKPRFDLAMVTVTLPEGITLTDEEIEEINSEYGGGS